MLTEAGYRYLLCIYDLASRREEITPSTVAKEMMVKRPTAFEFIKKLEREGYIRNSDGKYILTDQGIREAERIIRNHRIFETLLYRVGVKLDDACNLAEKVQIFMDDCVVDRICEFLGNPSTCPHGKPIPEGRKDDCGGC